jgi:hypothetical protein
MAEVVWIANYTFSATEAEAKLQKIVLNKGTDNGLITVCIRKSENIGCQVLLLLISTLFSHTKLFFESCMLYGPYKFSLIQIK